MGDTAASSDADDDPPALPAWAERVMADERAYWQALRDGGVITVEQGWGMIQRQRGDTP